MTVFDYDGDGWPDIFVCQRHAAEQALSQQPQRHVSPKKAMTAGVAYRRRRCGARRDGRRLRPTTTAAAAPHLLVGNFSNQMLGLYHNEGNGLFVDEAPLFHGRPREPAVARLRRVLLRLRSRRLSRHLRRQRPHRRRDRPRAAEDPLSGAAAAVPQSGGEEVRKRFDESGRPSSRNRWSRAAPHMPISITTAISTCCSTSNNGPAHLFRNDGGNRNHWLSIRSRSERNRIATASAP